MFLLQTLLLLRDADLRRLRPHHRWPGKQYRHRHSKLLMERAGLTRDFVRVRFVNSVPVEEVLPLW